MDATEIEQKFPPIYFSYPEGSFKDVQHKLAHLIAGRDQFEAHKDLTDQFDTRITALEQKYLDFGIQLLPTIRKSNKKARLEKELKTLGDKLHTKPTAPGKAPKTTP
jgi:hypothetical protein